jgi:hypothetical protein
MYVLAHEASENVRRLESLIDDWTEPVSSIVIESSSSHIIKTNVPLIQRP